MQGNIEDHEATPDEQIVWRPLKPGERLLATTTPMNRRVRKRLEAQARRRLRGLRRKIKRVERASGLTDEELELLRIESTAEEGQ